MTDPQEEEREHDFPDDLTSVIPASSLSATLDVCQAFKEDPSLKRYAQVSASVKALLVTGRQAFAPTREDFKAKKKEKEARKKDEDRTLARAAGIHAVKKQKHLAFPSQRPLPADQSLATSVVGPPTPLPETLLIPETSHTHIDDASAKTQSQADGNNNKMDSNDDGEESKNNDGDQSKTGEKRQREDDDDEVNTAADGSRKRRLNYSRKCHVCHDPFRDLHHFYDQMCPPCAALNWTKRNLTADMTGKIALVTGSRVKIGFEVTLSLLRCGAKVIGLTRFPRDAAVRFSQVPDFLEWSDRLEITGLDLRDIPAVHRFCHKFKQTHDRLDVIINNAAQTVRKPPAFYAHLLPIERKPLPEKLESMINPFDIARGGTALPSSVRSTLHVTGEGVSVDEKNHGDAAAAAAAKDKDKDASKDGDGKVSATDITHVNTQGSNNDDDASHFSMARSVALSLLPVAEGDEDAQPSHFPPGHFDEDMQQVDLRKTNSWVQRLGEISTVELLEVHVINSFAPWIINSELKPLLDATPGNKFIVNVSAQEGSFYKSKTIYHPQTNMAKASLNMMTRTAGADYAQSNIYMTCVDTGWITDEKPAGDAPIRERGCPLDLIDAAMRILDPVYVGANGGELHYGVFLKDYKIGRW